jgi:DNA processing protein
MSGSSERQRTYLFMAERLGHAPYALMRDLLAALDASDVTAWPEARWRERGLSDAQVARLTDPHALRGLDERLARMQREGIAAISCHDAVAAYSFNGADRLPPLLFVKGDLSRLVRPGLGVVGTRKPSAYGRMAAQSVAAEAVARGLAVISGAATGIDTAAHEGALKMSGLTVAVLGCGLFHVYPRSAGPLLERIAETGAVVSQFAPSVPPDRKTFPIRNEVIAVLSESVAVIEGAPGSGARYTADYARKLNRTLFALPGDITRPQAALPNRLIAEGARPILNPADVVDPLAAKASVQGELPLATAKKHRALTQPPTSGLSALAQTVLARIALGQCSADELLAAELAGPGEVNKALLDLELAGFIRLEPGRRYLLVAGL